MDCGYVERWKTSGRGQRRRDAGDSACHSAGGYRVHTAGSDGKEMQVFRKRGKTFGTEKRKGDQRQSGGML